MAAHIIRRLIDSVIQAFQLVEWEEREKYRGVIMVDEAEELA